MRILSGFFLATVILVALFMVGCESSRDSSPSRPKRATGKPGLQGAIRSTPNPQQSGRPVFEIRDGTVFLPGWDDRSPSAPLELARYDATVFESPAHVYRERAIITVPVAKTRSLVLPAGATEVGLLLRARAVENEWPRVHINLVHADEPANRIQLFAGHLVTHELRDYWFRLPAGYAGRSCRIEIELLNSSYLYDQRAVYVASIGFR
jgi:hypothetical protein